MTDRTCSCGFTESGAETITDHLLEAFAPDDSMGADGLRHEEADSLTCACGFRADPPSELDAHFLRIFTPGDLVGRDGAKHTVT